MAQKQLNSQGYWMDSGNANVQNKESLLRKQTAQTACFALAYTCVWGPRAMLWKSVEACLVLNKTWKQSLRWGNAAGMEPLTRFGVPSTANQPPELYSMTSCRKESGGWGVRADNALLLDSPFPTVIGYDRYQYEQIGSVISRAIQMKALQRTVIYDHYYIQKTP